MSMINTREEGEFGDGVTVQAEPQPTYIYVAVDGLGAYEKSPSLQVALAYARAALTVEANILSEGRLTRSFGWGVLLGVAAALAIFAIFYWLP